MADTGFARLDEDKRRRIIKGAIRESAEYGFDGTSTNRIVKRVGIAKGSLFNYFISTPRNMSLTWLSPRYNKKWKVCRQISLHDFEG